MELALYIFIDTFIPGDNDGFPQYPGVQTEKLYQKLF